MTAARKPPSRLALILPFAALGLFAIGWTVWWFVVAQGIERRVDQTRADLRAAGWTAAWESRRVDGYPFRTRLVFEGLSVRGPTGHGFEAPDLRAEAFAYQPTNWVVAAPEGLVLHRGAKGGVRVEGRAIRASATRLDRPIPNVAIELLEPRFTALPGAERFPIASAEKLEAYLRPNATDATSGDVMTRWTKARAPEGGVLNWLAGGGDFQLQLEGVITRFDRIEGEGWGPALRAWAQAGGAMVELRGAAEAGEAKAEAGSGRITVDPDGRLNGRVELTLTQGPAALAALAQSRTVDPGAAGAAAAVTSARGGLDGTARVTLVFEAGQTTLGPVRLAPAPKLF